MSELTNEPPVHVVALAERRAKARADRDFAAADALRDEIAGAGWVVKDTPGGFELTLKPPFVVYPHVREVPIPPGDARQDTALKTQPPDLAPVEAVVESQLLWDGSTAASRIDQGVTAPGQYVPKQGTVTVGLVVDGWPDDLRQCVRALLDHTDARIIGLDLGDVDGAGTALHTLAESNPDRIEAWHVAQRPHWLGGAAGWGESRTKLLQLDAGDIHVIMETSTILDGDAITPLVEAIHGDVVAAGWRGANPAPGDQDWQDVESGDVRGLLGYLFAVKRQVALDAGGFSDKARYYRNADLEFSLRLPGRLVVPAKDLPVHQERHRGYHEVDEDYREKESRRTYSRVLDLLRSPGRG